MANTPVPTPTIHVGVNPLWRIAALLLVVVCAGLVVVMFNQSITLTYMQVGYEDTKRDLEVLRNLAPQLKTGLTQKDLFVILRKQNPSGFIVQNENTVSFGQLRFVFDKSGQLTEVHHPL